MNEQREKQRGCKLLSLLLREESQCQVVIAGSDGFTSATNHALQLARQCTFGKRLCESKVALCESWISAWPFPLHHHVVVIPKKTWAVSEAQYAGFLAWLLSRQVLYELDKKTTFDEAIEATAQGVEAATLDDLQVDDDSKRAATERSCNYLRPRLISAQKRRIRRRRISRFVRRLRLACARYDFRVLNGKRCEATIFSVRIVGSPYFVASTRRAMESLAKTPSVYIAHITTRIREIREVSHLPNTKTVIGPSFALSGRNNEVLLVLWSELRRYYHPIQFAALLAWYSRDPSSPADQDKAIVGDGDANAIEELRFMYRVCDESRAPSTVLEKIEFQLRRYYNQDA